MLLRGFARLCARRTDVRLVMRSYGDDAARAEALAARLSISSHVTFVGELSPVEMARYCRAADAVAGFFVGPASGIPHFPLIIQEPLACAKPTVTYCDEKLASAMFGDDVPYILATDPDTIEDCLEEALSGGVRVERLVGSGLRWARRRLPAAGISQDLLALYETVLRVADKGGPPGEAPASSAPRGLAGQPRLSEAEASCVQHGHGGVAPGVNGG